MKKLCLLLICLILIAGCSKPAVKEPAKGVSKPRPDIPFAVDIIEKSVHRYIGGAEPKGMYLAFTIEIINIGDDALEISKEDIRLVDKAGNAYFIDELVSYYREDRFSEVTIGPDDDAEIRLAFDVPDPNKEFTLRIKEKSVNVG